MDIAVSSNDNINLLSDILNAATCIPSSYWYIKMYMYWRYLCLKLVKLLKVKLLLVCNYHLSFKVIIVGLCNN